MVWGHLNLTVGKTPVLYENESVLYTCRQVAIYNGDEKVPQYNQGTIYLTSHRICFVDDFEPEERSLSLNLDDIKSHEYIAKFLRSSAKVWLILRDARPETQSKNPWICEICTYSNQFSKKFVYGKSDLPICDTCGVRATLASIKKAIEMPTTSIERNESDLICPTCTFSNHLSLTQCEMCGATLNALRSRTKLGNSVRLSFRAGGSGAFYQHLQQALAEKAWETKAVEKNKEEILLGIHSLTLASTDRQKENQQAIDSAFQDVLSLQTKAKKLVALVEEYNKKNPQAVQYLGLEEGAIVSKDMAKDIVTYHQQLARQICEFLDSHNIVNNEGGVITLFDIYAIYNRARGIDLVAPNDIKIALELAEALGLPFRLRKLKNGLLVVENKLWKSTQQRLIDWISTMDTSKGVSCRDVWAHFGWSLQISTEVLELAEQEALLCRDEHISGLKYYQNILI